MRSLVLQSCAVSGCATVNLCCAVSHCAYSKAVLYQAVPTVRLCSVLCHIVATVRLRCAVFCCVYSKAVLCSAVSGCVFSKPVPSDSHTPALWSCPVHKSLTICSRGWRSKRGSWTKSACFITSHFPQKQRLC